MLRRVIMAVGASAMACGAIAATASADPATPLPKAANGKPVSVVATGLGVPTAFAFGKGVVFEADGGPQGQNGPTGPGGVYALRGGTATRLAGSPDFSGGVAYSHGTLYVTAAYANPTTHRPDKFQILTWSGWNGTAFKHRRVIYTAPKGFSGFNGIAVGPDGRLYVGVDVSLTESNDHGPATKKTPYLYDILSMNTKGKALKVFASGMRQPWQLAFAPGDRNPFVTDFGQDAPPGVKAPDFILHVHKGDNYGFPQCNWIKPRSKLCKGFAKPFRTFAPHTDLGGIGIIGKRFFLSQFGMGTAPAAVVTVPRTGGAKRTFVSGFTPGQFVIGLGTNQGWVYFGVLSGITGHGTVYRVHS
jgi:glucose/arabinose dehydrogenase